MFKYKYSQLLVYRFRRYRNAKFGKLQTFIVSKTACIAQRYLLGLMCLFGMANAYIMRACLSIAITQMVKTVTLENGHADPDACPSSSGTSSNSTIAGTGEFDWSEQTQGLILSAFYYGYIITHIPGGLLAQRFGGKQTLGMGIFSTAIFTLLTPEVARLGGAWPLIFMRFLMGMGEGVTFPALSTLLAQWAPPLERSKMAALGYAGVQIGMVIASALGGIIIQYVPGGWPNVFYIFGVVGVLWYILWCCICFNDPSSHPFITDEEKKYLQETIGMTERRKDLGSTPWGAMLTSAPIWALIIGEIGHDYGLYTMITDLPKYMNDVMRFDIAQNGILSSLPYIAMWFVSLSSGALSDYLLQKNVFHVTTLRKLLSTIGAIGPAIGVMFASYSGCDKTLVSILFTVGMGLMGFYYASLRVNALDLSPNFAGSIMAIVNGAGSISGMLAPYVIGLLTPNRTLKEWRVVFWVMFGVLVASNFVFMFFASAELQPWNEPKKAKSVENGNEQDRDSNETVKDTTELKESTNYKTFVE